MYIHFNRKYQKIIWLLIGFFVCCFLTNKVLALDIYTENGILTLPDIPSQYANYNFAIYTQSNDTFLIILPGQGSSDPYRKYISTSITFNTYSVQQQSPIYKLVNSSWSSYYTATTSSNLPYTEFLATTTDVYGREWADTPWILLYEANFGLSPDNPDYLNGYKKITLTSEDKYYMLSGLSTGSIFIPLEDFEEYGGRLSYYDNDLSSQPYTSYIQDYIITSDGLYARQDFDLSSYYGADFVMFSKYIYLEGEDDISYDIWVPEDIYDSQVTITPNSSGGNTFDFDYQDSNGDIQNEQVNSVDLSQDSPLLGNIFSDFSSNTFGLTSIIVAPLSLIRSLSSTSCSSLTVPLPYISSNLNLPCMSTIYSDTFGTFFNLYQTITTGIISYWVIVKIFNLVKDFKNPDHDEIEVIDL